MNKFFLSFFVLIISGFLPVSVFALPVEKGGGNEAIISFISNIVVQEDNSIHVVETITYGTGAQKRHGIYRDIYPYSSQKRKMQIENIVVTDDQGIVQPFVVSQEGKNVRIKIGDPNATFTGQRTYVISYSATRAVGQFDDLDEVYWNVAGDEWNIPKYFIQASVVLPVHAQPIQSACYVGEHGSAERCSVTQSNEHQFVFNTSRALSSTEDMTVAVGFKKGAVVAYTFSDNTTLLWQKYAPWITAIGLPICAALYAVWHWMKKGRDPKGRGVIVPQYDVPGALTPLEVEGIVYQRVSGAHIGAQIMYLATRGYIHIKQIETSSLILFKKVDYELVKMKEYGDLPNRFDQELMHSLFLVGTSTVRLSEFKNTFYKHIKKIRKTVLDALLEKGYYKHLGNMLVSSRKIGFRIIILFFWLGLMCAVIVAASDASAGMIALIIGVWVTFVILAVSAYVSPAKTQKGVDTREYILGLKEYLQVAEKDRLQFHNAPEKKPEIFEKFLPYAMVLGVTEIWAKEFEGVYTQSPAWFDGGSGRAFSALYFAHALNDFNTSAMTALTSNPRSSGSGGGGFSGGGGGGGGGGGW